MTKYGILFAEYKTGSIIQVGFFGIIAIKKLIFGFTLVVLNSFPFLNMTIFTI